MLYDAQLDALTVPWRVCVTPGKPSLLRATPYLRGNYSVSVTYLHDILFWTSYPVIIRGIIFISVFPNDQRAYHRPVVSETVALGPKELRTLGVSELS
jgi:hypothetical protein